MVQATSRTPRPAGSTDSIPRPATVSAAPDSAPSALLRLLARFSNESGVSAQIRTSSQASADRLAEWTRWTDAISLSEALSGGGTAARGAVASRALIDELAAGCARLRSELGGAVVELEALSPAVPLPGTLPETLPVSLPGTPPGLVPGPQPEPAAEPGSGRAAFAACRRAYQARQQAMEVAIGPLRARLRAGLAQASLALAQLAAVDAVMERVLQPHEQGLLARLPALLEARFMQLLPDAESGREIFHQELHELLRAELDFRMQAVEGLLEALRGTHKT